MLDAEDSANPMPGDHQDTERLLREAEVPFALLRNGWYTENYTAQFDGYLEAGEIVGAAGRGRISAASRADFASAAAQALIQDQVPISSPLLTPRSRRGSCRPTARIWRSCWGVPSRPSAT